jgi:hypothetical protein
MANIRIIWNNATDRTSSISANSTGGSLAASSLKTNTKSLAHRSGGTSVVYTLNWSTAERINGIILPATNLSSSATITASANGTTVGPINACVNTPLNSFPGEKNVNSFPYGGISKTAIWFNSVITTTSLTITLVDSGKASLGAPIVYPSYIDCSTIVCGEYWSPTINVSRNALTLSLEDTTQVSRTDGGDLIADRGTMNDKLSFNFDLLTKTDKEELIKILRYVGTYRNLAVSVTPDTNSRDEQDYIIYGKKDISSLDYIVHNYFSSSFSITGW